MRVPKLQPPFHFAPNPNSLPHRLAWCGIINYGNVVVWSAKIKLSASSGVIRNERQQPRYPQRNPNAIPTNSLYYPFQDPLHRI